MIFFWFFYIHAYKVIGLSKPFTPFYHVNKVVTKSQSLLSVSLFFLLISAVSCCNELESSMSVASLDCGVTPTASGLSYRFWFFFCLHVKSPHCLSLLILLLITQRLCCKSLEPVALPHFYSLTVEGLVVLRISFNVFRGLCQLYLTYGEYGKRGRNRGTRAFLLDVSLS